MNNIWIIIRPSQDKIWQFWWNLNKLIWAKLKLAGITDKVFFSNKLKQEAGVCFACEVDSYDSHFYPNHDIFLTKYLWCLNLTRLRPSPEMFLSKLYFQSLTKCGIFIINLIAEWERVEKMWHCHDKARQNNDWDCHGGPLYVLHALLCYFCWTIFKCLHKKYYISVAWFNIHFYIGSVVHLLLEFNIDLILCFWGDIKMTWQA